VCVLSEGEGVRGVGCMVGSGKVCVGVSIFICFC